jgi:hypothetical protein
MSHYICAVNIDDCEQIPLLKKLQHTLSFVIR